jgi:hypothetical protein
MNICHYSIVRFRPFSETGEFANVGVVALEENTGRIQYRLAPKRFGRVTKFFEDLDARLFSASIALFEEELIRITELSSVMGDRQTSRGFFAGLVRGRETVVFCSEIRSAALEVPFDTFLDQLYGRYIKRDFATQQHREGLMVREIKARLKRAKVAGFKARHIRDDVVPITFDLASKRGDKLYVIKPLAFDKKKAIEILDHSARWRERLNYLFSQGKLDRDKVLLTVDPPRIGSETSMFEAFDVARKNLETLHAQVIDYDNEPELYDFALRGGTSQRELMQ